MSTTCSRLINKTRKKSLFGRKLISSDLKHGHFQYLPQQSVRQFSLVQSVPHDTFIYAQSEMHLIGCIEQRIVEEVAPDYSKRTQNQIIDLLMSRAVTTITHQQVINYDSWNELIFCSARHAVNQNARKRRDKEMQQEFSHLIAVATKSNKFIILNCFCDWI